MNVGARDVSRRRRVRRRVLRDRRRRIRRPAGRAERLTELPRDGHGDQARSRVGDHGRASARARSHRHLRHDLHRAADVGRRATCATSRSSRMREVDRSPCGTGTCAVLAVLDAMGLVEPADPFVHESIIGTTFSARVVERDDGRRLRRDRARAHRRARGSPANTRSSPATMTRSRGASGFDDVTIVGKLPVGRST